MKGMGGRLLGTVVAAVAAATIGLAARSLSPLGFGWAIGGAALALMLVIVAANSYHGRRDPGVLLLSAGAAAAGLGLASFGGVQLYIARRSVNGPIGDGLSAFESYMLLGGLLVFAICLASMVPWRDRRGRPPLRVWTVAVAVGVPMAATGALLLMFAPAPTRTAAAVIAGVTIVVALVAAARSIARGGWYTWVGGGAFALAVAHMGVVGRVELLTSDRLIAYAAFAWLALMPAVAMFELVVGVTSAQRAEAFRLRRASDRATQVMEGRAEIASIVAHDVRGPAGTIRSIAGSLRTSYGRLRDDERLEFVGMIEQESLRLLRVADQMSLGLKTDAGTLAFTLVGRDMEGPVLQGVHDADVASRDVRVDLDHSLRAELDERWLAEAIRQGLENAMKFSPADSPIEIRGRVEGDSALLEMEDRGPGIPEDMREAVFQKFCRWRPHGYEDQPGSGLGLFVVRSIAQEHGGEALVTEGSHGGTILQIRLPLEGAL